MIGPVVMEMAEDAYNACREAEALICLGVFSAFGQAIAEALRIPIIHIEPTPLAANEGFPALSWPVQRDLTESGYGLNDNLSTPAEALDC